MTSLEKEQAKIICLRCGYPNSNRASRCSQCDLPLDDFASTAPWEMGYSKSSTRQSAYRPRRKSIILLGAWLYFAPAAFVSFWYAGIYAMEWISAFQTTSDHGVKLWDAKVIGSLFLFLLGGVSLWVLWSVSKSYFRK